MTSVYPFFGGSFFEWLGGGPEREGIYTIPANFFVSRPEGRKPIGRLSKAATRIILCTAALNAAQKRAAEWGKDGQPHQEEWEQVFDYIWEGAEETLTLLLKAQLRIDLIADGINLNECSAIGFIENGDLYIIGADDTIPAGPFIII
jgi:hypothetical protein